MEAFTFRRATPEDAKSVATRVHEGLAAYSAFAPPGWVPPPVEVGHVRHRLSQEGVWCLIAEARGQEAGHVAFLPSSLSRWPAEEGMAHFWQLFVEPQFWGSGLATELNQRAVRAAAARGYRVMRLYAAADQHRARRFYEREGWTAAGPAFENADLGMPLVEYRLPLVDQSARRYSSA